MKRLILSLHRMVEKKAILSLVSSLSLAISVMLGLCGCRAGGTAIKSPVWVEKTPAEFVSWLPSSPAVNTLKGTARLRMNGQSLPLPTTEVVLAGVPDRLRVESYGPWGQALFMLSLKERKAVGYLAAENICFTGEADDWGLGENNPSGITMEQLAAFILGRLPANPATPEQAFINENGSRIKLITHLKNSLVQEWLLAFTDHLLQSQTLTLSDSEGQTLWTATLSDYDTVGAIRFPRTRVFSMSPISLGGFRLEFESLELNPELSPEAFTLTPPPGASVVSAKEVLAGRTIWNWRHSQPLR